MILSNKTILIISPQPWSNFYVSKHNYAIELSKLNNNIYFLNPPSKECDNLSITSSEFKNLKIINYRVWFSTSLRFHFKYLFTFLMKIQAKKIIKNLACPIDILWCFETNLYPNLNWFKAKFKIYHPVDYLNTKEHIKIGETADIIFSVTDNILNLFNKIKTPKYFINHGLSDYYVNQTIKASKTNNPIRFAYIGNLLIPGIDRVVLKKIIKNNPEIQFHFFGHFDTALTNGKESISFINFLKSAKNVQLKGILHPKELCKELIHYDGFLLCYNPSKELENSHKILEYLSCGKLLIANKVGTYRDKPADLFLMATTNDNSDYYNLFLEGLKNINQLNRSELVKFRRDYALKNSYAKNIKKIEKILNSNHFS